MIPYAAMLAVPSLFALAGARRTGSAFLVIALLYWLMVGFRFHVGMDWENYLYIYSSTVSQAFSDLLFHSEPGFKLLMWVADRVGGGIILVNAVSALIFCWGYFAVARQCREPFLAVVIGTPLLVVAFAMSGTRQALAMGITFYLYATWERRSVVGRVLLVLLACLFHFSAVFVLVFVALSARIPGPLKAAAVGTIVLMISLIVYLAPGAMEAYSRLYVSGSQRVDAPGAIVQVAVLAAPAAAFFLYRRPWLEANGDNLLYKNQAVAALFAIPAVYLSSVGAYRFALYLWPMAMYIGSGMTAIMHNPVGRMLYRLALISAAYALLGGWLVLSNNGAAWLPYQNWLLVDDFVSLHRR